MAAIQYDKFANNFLNAYNSSADRAYKHKLLAQEAEARKEKLLEQSKAYKKKKSLDSLKVEQLQKQIEHSNAKNTRLEMEYTKKETIDYIQRYIDGGMKDNNIAKLAITGSDIKKQLYGDVVDVRDLNSNTDVDYLNKIVSELNANSKFDNGTPDDKSDDRPWAADDVIASNKYKVLVDSKGNSRVKNIDELLAATGYKNYIDNKTWERQVQLLKLKKKETTNKPSGTMQVINDYMEQYKLLHPKSTAEELSAKRMEQIDKMTTKSFQAREADNKNDAKTLIEEIPFEKIVSSKLDDAQLTKLQEIENGNHLTAKELTDMSTNVSMLNKLDKGIKQLSELDADDIGIGFKSIKTSLGKYFDPDKASQEELNAAIKKLQALGTLGGVLAEYIKSMSGTAASDAERSFLKMVMSGGDYISKESRVAALKNFQDNVTKNIKVKFNLLYNRAPATVYRAYHLLDNKGESAIEKKFDKYKVK